MQQEPDSTGGYSQKMEWGKARSCNQLGLSIFKVLFQGKKERERIAFNGKDPALLSNTASWTVRLQLCLFWWEIDLDKTLYFIIWYLKIVYSKCI